VDSIGKAVKGVVGEVIKNKDKLNRGAKLIADL